MLLPDRIAVALGRRHERATRAAVQRVVDRRAHDRHHEAPVVLSQGDLICFKVSVRPC